MKRLLQWVGAVVLVMLAGPSGTAAQTATFGLGGGLTPLNGYYGSVEKAGWHILGKLDFAIPILPLAVRVDALYGQTSHKAPYEGDGNTTLIGGLANLVWKIPTAAPMMTPYVIAGGGVYHVKITIPSVPVDTSATTFAFDLGAGVNVGAGPVHLFVEGRYLNIRERGSSVNFIPLTAGVSFGSK